MFDRLSLSLLLLSVDFRHAIIGHLAAGGLPPRGDSGRKLRMMDGPRAGDIVITTAAGLHYLSVYPHPHRLSFDSLERAEEIARRWTRANPGAIWHERDGVTVKLGPDVTTAPSKDPAA